MLAQKNEVFLVKLYHDGEEKIKMSKNINVPLSGISDGGLQERFDLELAQGNEEMKKQKKSTPFSASVDEQKYIIQENYNEMNKKIQDLIKQLADECQKEDVSLSLATLNSEGDMAIAQTGNRALVALAVLEQYDQEKQELLETDCNCHKHRALKRMFGIETEDKPTNKHTIVTDDPNDVLDILSKILRGEFK